MLISTETGSLKIFGGDNEGKIAAIKNAGFDAYDFTMFRDTPNRFCDGENAAEDAKKLRRYADGLGILCNQAHAPFPTYVEGDDGYNKAITGEILRAIDVAATLGAKVVVIHPVNNFSPERNAERYEVFGARAKEDGIKIGVENMWNWAHGSPHATPAACSSPESYAAHMALLPETFVACVDIGHAEMEGLGTSAAELIRTLGKRVGAIHLHDNDKHEDLHRLPYLGKIDYNSVAEALAENYSGDITLETFFMHGFPPQLVPSALRLMRDVADDMRKRVIAAKNRRP